MSRSSTAAQATVGVVPRPSSPRRTAGATALYISGGTPPKVVQRTLGHASVTMDRYGHLYADEMDTRAGHLDQIAGGMDVQPECGQTGDAEEDEGPAEVGPGI